ncbi:MAG: RNA polymerase sigma factor [Emergencia sp.]
MTKQSCKDFFCQIYDSTYRRASLLVTSKCRNPDDISDILQETYAEVYSTIQKKGSSYIKAPEGLVLDIARKKIWKYYNGKEPQSVTDFYAEDTCQIPYPGKTPGTFQVDEAFLNRETLREIRQIVDSKPEDTRRIFCLFYLHDQTIPEIAQTMSVSQSFVKNRLYRLVNEIRTIYGKGDI